MPSPPSPCSSPPSPPPTMPGAAGGSSRCSRSPRTWPCSPVPAAASSTASCTRGPCRSTTRCTASSARRCWRRSPSPPRWAPAGSSPHSPGASTSASTARSATRCERATGSCVAETLRGRAAEIVDAALELLEADGPAALSMRRVADRVGIRAPSIYEHLADKRALESAIISRGFELQTAAFAAAVDGATDPLQAIAAAYRDFAAGHPHLYRLMTAHELDRAALAEGVEQRAAATLVAAAGGDGDLSRAMWAFAHGMTILELDRRFPPGADLDAAWARGLAAFRSV